ncbi:STAS domain-containing protein [Vibrio sp.]|uniref:STAS domain-containing protein n=1 Tax=Vibrio sp. TaxID=678 RepID=UPI003D12DFCE
MSHPQWQVVNAERILLRGALDRETVPHLWSEIQSWRAGASQCDVSLADVERIDSAGMVMLIHLIEHAKNQNCHIILSFVPQQLRTLFQLSNIETMLAQHINHQQE